MAEKEARGTEYVGEKKLTDDGAKILEENEVEGVNPTLASIIAKNKPNPWGRGHLQLYALATVVRIHSSILFPVSQRNDCNRFAWTWLTVHCLLVLLEQYHERQVIFHLRSFYF